MAIWPRGTIVPTATGFTVCSRHTPAFAYRLSWGLPRGSIDSLATTTPPPMPALDTLPRKTARFAQPETRADLPTRNRGTLSN